ncbi:MAG: putative lipid II flippase FtsW [Patescibacteria group bacterium]
MRARQPDYILLATVSILVVFGLLMISSASIGLSQEQYNESYYFLRNQILKGLLPGIAVGLLFYLLPYRFLKKFAPLLLVSSIAALLLIFIPGFGLEHGGSQRWLKISSVVFQPSEFLKFSLVVYLAAWLSSRGEAVKSVSQGLVSFSVLLGLIAIILIKEPDIGTLGVVGFTAISIFFLAGARLSHILCILGGGGALLAALINFVPYIQKRWQTFRFQDLDPQGAGYQINQSLIALGSGGLFGLGLGQSLQKFLFLPEPASDSILAIIGEELGFLGIAALLLMFVIFAFRGLSIARRAPDEFGHLLAGGLTSWLIIQALINILAISGLMPLTGITLPFISLGGSSLTATLAAAGLLLNVSKYSKI